MAKLHRDPPAGESNPCQQDDDMEQDRKGPEGTSDMPRTWGHNKPEVRGEECLPPPTIAVIWGPIYTNVSEVILET